MSFKALYILLLHSPLIIRVSFIIFIVEQILNQLLIGDSTVWISEKDDVFSAV